MKVCPTCGKEFLETRHKSVRFCSYRCSKIKPVLIRFNQRTPIKPVDGCWPWKGYLEKNGYGTLSVNNKNTYVHRLSYELHVGLIPEGMFVCHKCDNPPCVNPAHLFLGTCQDNLNDCRKKGRHARGERQHCHKLTEDQVRTIRATPAIRGNSKVLAKKYGVTSTLILMIQKGIVWKHLGALPQIQRT